MLSYWVNLGSQERHMFLTVVRTAFIVTLIIGTDDAANITLASSSVTAPLYTLANFTCEGIGDVLEWTVGGNTVPDPSNQGREISVTTNNISVGVWSSVLTIRALPINDEITVQCSVITFNPFDFAARGAELRVNGALPVENLHLAFNFTSSSWLTWSHPFKNYPLSYHIYIENQHGQLLYNDITNDTSYELYNLTVCDIYTATVVVTVTFNGRSYTSSNVSIQEEYSGEYILMIHNHTVLFDNSDNKINVMFWIN